MVKTIWKVRLVVTDEQIIRLPRGARILSLQVQHRDPCLWAMVDPRAESVGRRIVVHGTGHDASLLPDDAAFIGTFQMHGGSLVFHVFDLGEVA